MIKNQILFQRLQDAGLLDKSKRAEIQKRATEGLAYEIIRASENVPDAIIGQIMADLFEVPFVDLKKRVIHEQTLGLVPEVIARSQLMIPFRQDDTNIDLAMADPDRIDLVSYLEKITSKTVRPYFATKDNIIDTLGLYKTKLQADLADILNAERAEGKVIIQLLDTLLQYAFINRASDIHIEPQQATVMIRFRIDGELHDVAELPQKFLGEVTTRVKILARLRTDEHRSAQDGKFHYDFDDQSADVRVSIVPITKGEKIVLRILAERHQSFSLEELGMDESQKSIVRKAMLRPYGMILATGPTGAGKTTTLYAMIKELNSRTVNISTIEDPVEYNIDGVNQIQVNPKTNVTFAQGLKSILRQDPDIIMVGEIRDNETASIAINAAMTGHLVLSTLHTNDAATTLPRLLDMQVEPFLIASTVNLAIAQRLVRHVHQGCMESYLPTKDELSRLAEGLSPQERNELDLTSHKIHFFRGKGCDLCHGTGFEGRIGIFELLEITDEIRALVMSHANSDVIRSKAVQQGMRTMYFDGLKKVLEGKTTVDEVLRTARV
jgi:type IV pilus assembly protein PilB